MHRFAITFHRQLHNKNSLSSRLDQIQGVGPKTRAKLLKKYGSLKKIAAAPVSDLHELGLSETVAQTVHVAVAAMVTGEAQQSLSYLDRQQTI